MTHSFTNSYTLRLEGPEDAVINMHVCPYTETRVSQNHRIHGWGHDPVKPKKSVAAHCMTCCLLQPPFFLCR